MKKMLFLLSLALSALTINAQVSSHFFEEKMHSKLFLL
jgi:hypothetical protein